MEKVYQFKIGNIFLFIRKKPKTSWILQTFHASHNTYNKYMYNCIDICKRPIMNPTSVSVYCLLFSRMNWEVDWSYLLNFSSTCNATFCLETSWKALDYHPPERSCKLKTFVEKISYQFNLLQHAASTCNNEIFCCVTMFEVDGNMCNNFSTCNATMFRCKL